MADWEAGIISKDAKYQNTYGGGSGGIWNLNDQLRHRDALNWSIPFEGWPSASGQRVPCTITTGTINDTTEDFNVHHEDFDAAAAAGLTGRLYFAVKCTAATAYQNDFCVGHVQITDDGYSAAEHTWEFNTLSDFTDWEYPLVSGLGVASDSGYEDVTDILAASAQSWVACANGASNYRWGRASNTNSGSTGAADGVNLSGAIVGSATTTIAQSATTFYAVTESSGSNVSNRWFWMRSPEVTLSGNGDKNISISYNAYTAAGSNGMQDSAGEPLFRWWWKV